jgi:hypothetical protein
LEKTAPHPNSPLLAIPPFVVNIRSLQQRGTVRVDVLELFEDQRRGGVTELSVRTINRMVTGTSARPPELKRVWAGVYRRTGFGKLGS